MKTWVPYIISCLLGILALGTTSLVAWGYWQIYGIGGWRDQLYASEGSVATREALDDFRAGYLRLYSLGGESERNKYSGTNDGPFELWIPQYYPSLGRAHRFSREQFVAFYNRKMRYMQTHPDQFRGETNKAQPGGAAILSHPVGSETNSTSAATDSGR
jgi:hypothetical protein